MHLFRYEIPKIETSDNEHHSESDKDYVPDMEKYIIDDDHESKERGEKEDDHPYAIHDTMAEVAPPYPSEIVFSTNGCSHYHY